MADTSKEPNKITNFINQIITAGRIGKTTYNNPLLNWSAEIVEIPKSIQRPEKSFALRKRNIEQMHKNNKKDQTVASIKIVKESISDITDVQDRFRRVYSGAITSNLDETEVLFETTNFILQAMGETDSEKFQILDNFGEAPQIFMFGRRPRIFTYSGMLWNNQSNNWKDEFRYIYDNYLRGTKCIEYGVKILLTYDRSVRLGYILNSNINQNAETEMAVPFNFSMFIEDGKELVDVDVIDPSSQNNSTDIFNQEAFSLVRQQGAKVTEEARLMQSAIDRKIEINSQIISPEKNTPISKITSNQKITFNPEITEKEKEEARKNSGNLSESETSRYVKYENITGTGIVTDTSVVAYKYSAPSSLSVPIEVPTGVKAISYSKKELSLPYEKDISDSIKEDKKNIVKNTLSLYEGI